MQWQRVMRSCLLALGAAFGMSALGILFLRWSGDGSAGRMLLSFSIGCALLFAIAYSFLKRTELPKVSAQLDARAGTQEQFTTWLYLRSQAAGDELRECFKSAQAAATIATAQRVHIADVLPWNLPAWHRAVWLALVLLLSAVLMPARKIEDPALEAARVHGARHDLNLAQSNTDGKASAENSAARVQVLSPAQLRKLQLVATDADLPKTVKAQALRELLNAIGEVPESALTQDTQQILEMLRRDTRELATKKEASGALVSGSEAPKAVVAPPARGAEFDPLSANEQARAAVASHFPDVQSELVRYYEKGIPDNGIDKERT